MKLSNKLKLVWCIAIITLTACSFLPANFIQPPITPEAQFQLPVNTPSPKCTPPCFYGIVPDQTTITETLSLLKASPKQVINNRLLEWNTEASVRWNHILFERGVAKAIVLYEPTGETFGQIVDKHGEPQQVVVGYPDAGVAGEDFYFVYPSKGVAYFSAKPEPSSRWPADAYVPTPDMPVLGTVYFEPDTNKDLKKHSWTIDILSAARISPWHGFGQSYYAP